MMKNLFLTICICALLPLILLSCGPGPETPPEVSLDDALIDLPKAVNAPEQAGQPLPSLGSEEDTVDDEVIREIGELFNPIRELYTPLAAAVIDYADVLLELIDDHIFGNPGIMQTLFETGVFAFTDDATGEKFKVTQNENQYGVELWNLIDDTWLKIMDIDFTVDDNRTHGTIYSREPQLDEEYRPEYRIDFDTDDPELGKVMEMRLTNLDFDDPEIDLIWENYNIPGNLWLKAYGDNETLNIAVNVAYQNVFFGDADAFGVNLMTILNNDVPYVDNTTRVDVNYVYRGVFDVVNDRGKVDLALVPAAKESIDEIFTEYSVGAVHRKAISDWIRTGSEDGVRVLDAMNLILLLAGSELLLNENSDDEKVFEALVIVKDYFEAAGENVNGLQALIFIVDLENPGYLDSVSGFVGNDKIRRPAWVDEIPSVEEIDVLSAAEVAGDDFEVVMPNDTEPDF